MKKYLWIFTFAFVFLLLIIIISIFIFPQGSAVVELEKGRIIRTILTSDDNKNIFIYSVKPDNANYYNNKKIHLATIGQWGLHELKNLNIPDEVVKMYSSFSPLSNKFGYFSHSDNTFYLGDIDNSRLNILKTIKINLVDQPPLSAGGIGAWLSESEYFYLCSPMDNIPPTSYGKFIICILDVDKESLRKQSEGLSRSSDDNDFIKLSDGKKCHFNEDKSLCWYKDGKFWVPERNIINEIYIKNLHDEGQTLALRKFGDLQAHIFWSYDDHLYISEVDNKIKKVY